MELLDGMNAENGARSDLSMSPWRSPRAVFVYGNGASQVFDASGATTYVEAGRKTHREWYLYGEGRFCSFWPPSYRA